MAQPSLPSPDPKTPSDAANGGSPMATIPPTHDSGPKWHTAPCITVGCHVMIRWRVGEFYQPTCKWCRGGTAYNTRGSQIYPQEGEWLSKEEFGVDLFEAITVQAGLRQAEHTAELFRRKELDKRVIEMNAQIKAMNQQLTAILNKGTINDSDLQRLLGLK